MNFGRDVVRRAAAHGAPWLLAQVVHVPGHFCVVYAQQDKPNMVTDSLVCDSLDVSCCESHVHLLLQILFYDSMRIPGQPQTLPEALKVPVCSMSTAAKELWSRKPGSDWNGSTGTTGSYAVKLDSNSGGQLKHSSSDSNTCGVLACMRIASIVVPLLTESDAKERAELSSLVLQPNEATLAGLRRFCVVTMVLGSCFGSRVPPPPGV